MRLPPTLDSKGAIEKVQNFFKEYKPINGVKFTVENPIEGTGFSCPTFDPKIIELA